MASKRSYHRTYKSTLLDIGIIPINILNIELMKKLAIGVFT